MKNEARDSMASSQWNRIELKGRLDGARRTRLGRLLNMMYRPSEIASEVGFNRRQFYRVYLPAGCPQERDARGHVWINGKDFREWYIERYKKLKLDNGEAFCLSCKKAVIMNGENEFEKDGLLYLVCSCPACGRKLSKITDKKGK